jgi:hypothetical protein
MTQINENGQMYFTFEELDFTGTRLLITNEVNDLMKLKRVIFARFSTTNFYSSDWFLIDADYNAITKRIETLFEVRDYIKNLDEGGDFLG